VQRKGQGAWGPSEAEGEIRKRGGNILCVMEGVKEHKIRGGVERPSRLKILKVKTGHVVLISKNSAGEGKSGGGQRGGGG